MVTTVKNAVRIGGGAMVLALLSALSACGDDAGGSDDGSVTTTGDQEVTTTTVTGGPDSTDVDSDELDGVDERGEDRDASGEEAGFPRVVEHDLGETEISAPPRRVVTLDMTFVDAALTLETPILGYTTFGEAGGELPDYFGAAREAYAADAELLGDLMAPNVETIAELQPDLILSASVRHEEIHDELSAIAPTVMSDSAGAGWKDNLRLTAEALGKRDLAEERIAAYEERAAAVGADVNEVADAPEVSVVRFVEQIRLYQAASFSGVVIEDAGIARPENQRDTDDFIVELSPEELDQADADHVFYTVYSESEAQASRQQAMESGLWDASLSAAREGRAHEVPDETWMSAVGMFGAHHILTDLADTFGVDRYVELSPLESLLEG